ncbi:MAG: hypothetical protein IPJ71_02575 [Bdellovibrionales bacterium]|nr:hypothetical protein [Bdellovibrionales bacterium]
MAKKKKKVVKTKKKTAVSPKKTVVKKASTKKVPAKKVAKPKIKLRSKAGSTQRVTVKLKDHKDRTPKAKADDRLVAHEDVASKEKKAEKKPKKLKVETERDKEVSPAVTKKEAPTVLASSEDLGDSDDAGDHEVESRPPEEIVLTDAEGRRYCRRRDCDQLAIVESYCRYHYLLFWKKIQQRKKILCDGKLIHYIEELTSRYPDKYLEMIRRDLRTEKDFMAAIQELEIDESGGEDGEFDEDSSILEEVRGASDTHSREDDDF